MKLGELAKALGTTSQALREFAPADLARCGENSKISDRVATLLAQAWPQPKRG